MSKPKNQIYNDDGNIFGSNRKKLNNANSIKTVSKQDNNLKYIIQILVSVIIFFMAQSMDKSIIVIGLYFLSFALFLSSLFSLILSFNKNFSPSGSNSFLSKKISTIPIGLVIILIIFVWFLVIYLLQV